MRLAILMGIAGPERAPGRRRSEARIAFHHHGLAADAQQDPLQPGLLAHPQADAQAACPVVR